MCAYLRSEQKGAAILQMAKDPSHRHPIQYLRQ